MIGADILTQAMFESGTSVVFSLSGNQIMPIYDACLEPGIRIIHVRHESAAVFMADAYAQISMARVNHSQCNAPLNTADSATSATGLMPCGVALVTAGPGFANALGGLYSALMAESPVVLISGDSAVAQDGKRAFQEVSQTTASAPFVKHAMRVKNVDQLADAWLECIAIATTGRPGPVHLAVPFDVLLAEGSNLTRTSASTSVSAAGDLQSAGSLKAIEESRSADNNFADITNALLTAKKPLVLCGPALTPSRMQQRFRRWQNELGMPVIAMESPRGLSDPSLGKLSAVVKEADCILLLGKLPDFTVDFASFAKVPAQTIIVVDSNNASLHQSMSVLAARDALLIDDSQDESSGTQLQDSQVHDSRQHGKQQIIAVHTNPEQLADAICDKFVRSVEQVSWLDFTQQQLAATPQVPVAAKDSTTEGASNADQSVLTPQQIGNWVQVAVDQCEQSIVVCDGGEFGQWAQACVRSDLRVINGPSGAIGGSLPQAIAAKIARPQCIVFAMLGDGTSGFHLAELETSVREQAPVVVIIGNDSRWNAEYQIQLRDYGADRLHSCELGTNVRYDIAAVGLGCAGAMVQTEAELRNALSDAVTRCEQEEQSTCINVAMSGWPAPVFE